MTPTDRTVRPRRRGSRSTARWQERTETMRSKTFIAVWLAVGSVVAVAAGGPDGAGMSAERLERVTSVLDRYIDAGEIPGAVSLIYRHGEVAHVVARGVLDLGTRSPMRRDTIFGLASMTKPVVAAAAMILVEEDKIRLDEPVDRWLPELANRKVLDDPHGPLEAVHDAPRPITLRDLLRYTMGLGTMGYAGIADDAPIARTFATVRRGDVTADEYMARWARSRSSTRPASVSCTTRRRWSPAS